MAARTSGASLLLMKPIEKAMRVPISTKLGAKAG
jgi:hypothetical protein